MKAKLIKKADGWYNLYNGEIGIGSTHEELQGYKLPKQNCDDIFGVIDVEKLAENYEKENFNGDLEHHPLQIFKAGFNKAMELNKDKLFTLEDMMNCWNKALKFQDHKETLGEYIQSIQQPTEIEVEIEMKKVVDETKVIGAVKGVKGSGDKITTYKTVPKLDLEGCLIFKKI